MHHTDNPLTRETTTAEVNYDRKLEYVAQIYNKLITLI